MPTGTEKVIGMWLKTQRPLDEKYLNEGVPWADEAEVLAGIPIGERCQYLIVNIAGALYWFLANKTTLQAITVSTLQASVDIAITDAGGLFDATEVEAALAEVKTQANATDAAITAMGTGTLQTPYRIDLTAQSSVAARVAAAVETTDYPTGWVLAANSTVNLLITHTLTGRKLSNVNIFEIDGSNERLLTPFNSAFTGILCNGLTVLIEGLAPTALALRIELIFD
jgi:hypothetical protein